MEEADYLCNRVAIINKGKFISIGTPTALKNSLRGDIIEIKSQSSAAKIISKIKAMGNNDVTAPERKRICIRHLPPAR